MVRSIRALDIKKAPSISETIDWARTLLYLGHGTIDPQVIGETLHVLLKYQTDIAKARKELVDTTRRSASGLPRVDAADGVHFAEAVSDAMTRNQLEVPSGVGVGRDARRPPGLRARAARRRAPGLDDREPRRDARRRADPADRARDVPRGARGDAGEDFRHRRAFDTVFDVYFSLYSGGIGDEDGGDGEGGDGETARSPAACPASRGAAAPARA